MSSHIEKPPVWESNLRDLFKQHLEQQYMRGYERGVTDTSTIIYSALLKIIENGADIAYIKQFCEAGLGTNEE